MTADEQEPARLSDSWPQAPDDPTSAEPASDEKDMDRKKGFKRRTASSKRISARGDQKHSVHHEEGPKGTFVDATAMKEKVREKLSKPKYNVHDYYYTTGIPQKIARSGMFDKATLLVIAVNALWIAIDTDMNHATLLLEAQPIFMFAENFFCAFFSFEWLVRFLSFRRKLNGLKDAWFVFDSFMVCMMVLETWIFTLLVVLFLPNTGGAGGNAGIMRLARLLRLSRMARMGKLLRVMPELMIMIKGMKAAMRSVFFTLVLLVVIMYVFAIAFTQLASGNEVGSKFFSAVPESMYTLLIFGIFLDNIGTLTSLLGENPILVIMFMAFILVGALTVMNMLVGVLCEVVSAVASTEQEEMLVNYVNEKISRVMALLDSDGGGSISKKEFMQILENVEAVRCLNDVGVDVFALIDLADYIFEDDDTENDEEIELDFSRFMEVVLQLRGTNQATVKDIVDLRKFMRLAMQEHYKQTSLILEKLADGARLSEEVMERMVQPNGQQLVNGSMSNPFGDNDAELSADFLFDDDVSVDRQVSTTVHTHAGEFQVEGGFPPSLPRATPNGQLLSWVPIPNPNFIPAPAYGENLALRGKWERVDDNACVNALNIPVESDTKYQSGTDAALRIPRLHTSSNSGVAASDDPDMDSLQLHFETVCGQLAGGLNDALEMAERSFKKRYIARLTNHPKMASALVAEKSPKSQVLAHLGSYNL